MNISIAWTISNTSFCRMGYICNVLQYSWLPVDTYMLHVRQHFASWIRLGSIFCFIFIRIFVYFPLEFLHFFSPAFNNIFCHHLYISLVPYLRDILALSTYFTLNLFDCWCKLLKISCEQGFHFKSKAFFLLNSQFILWN